MHALLRRRGVIAALLLALVGLGALALLLTGAGQNSEAPRGGPITMASTDGAFSLSHLTEDQIAMVSFGYTSCPDVCPITLAMKRQALAQFDESIRERIVPVMITVDLERDTLARLREYVSAFGDEFIGLVGTPDELEDVTERYGVVWQRREATDSTMAYTVDHTAGLFLVNREGVILERVLYSPTPSALVSALDRELERGTG
ncbi:SCO family protein [Halomonas sp. PAMB 3232]|uniref:SCO family protein n=1 Tax=Halomonas sp. PAMB 3232 TaxID=3075221 RepID=UPI0028A12136|nr:SCO family protein [Halomonas sp. PAMB 3232]WNL39116.1 SCO family protein [Halomonas sp. PAMB 3232]